MISNQVYRSRLEGICLQCGEIFNIRHYGACPECGGGFVLYNPPTSPEDPDDDDQDEKKGEIMKDEKPKNERRFELSAWT